MMSSFRATAIERHQFGLAGCDQAVEEGFQDRLCFFATIAPMKMAARTAVRPPPMKLLPRHLPDWRVNGARPTRAVILLVAELPELGSSATSVREMTGPTPARK